MEIILMQGLPGSGKSHFINNYIKHRVQKDHDPSEFIICSADHYQVDGEGNYDFKPERAGDAHRSCQWKYLGCLIHEDMLIKSYNTKEKRVHTLFVDNTNTSAWEISPYIAMAGIYEFPVRIIRIHCSFEVACMRNVHKVPPETIWKMHQNLLTEKFPPHWKIEIALPQTQNC